jgi:hypothetical protein
MFFLFFKVFLTFLDFPGPSIDATVPRVYFEYFFEFSLDL